MALGLGHHPLDSSSSSSSSSSQSSSSSSSSPPPPSWLLQAREAPDHDHHHFNAGQLGALRLASLVVASVSIASTMLATFWFVRMRRSFRHDLILLLVQSDMLKALCFIILPAVELSNGPVASPSVICQASGFFLSLGIEACDVAVVLVALHTALYIFRGRSGLYPYRRLAYAAFVLVPLLLASLAFVNQPAYANLGQYCYLPSSPAWSSSVLSWIPRYVILATICVTYVSTYIYVKILMTRFGEAGTASRPSLARLAAAPGHGRGHGRRPAALLASTNPAMLPCDTGCETDRRDRKLSLLSTMAPTPSQGEAAFEHAEQASLALGAIQCNMPRFGIDSAKPLSLHQDASVCSSVMPASCPCQRAVEERGAPRRTSTSFDSPSAPPRPYKWTLPLTRSKPAARPIWNRLVSAGAMAPATLASSAAKVLDMVQCGPCGPDSSRSVFLSPTALGATGMAKTRDKIRRQLLQLFIYPAVYIVVWFIPFISHVMGKDGEGGPASFGLSLASLVSLCVHGIADALVFSVLEKPWRHAKGGDSSCFTFWQARLLAEGTTTAKVGRTREEMQVDSRIASRRRQEELAELRLLRLVPQAAPQEWWDVRLERVDGPVEQHGGVG